MKVQRNGREFTVEVTADGEGVVSHAGTALLAETADRIGLTNALSRGLAPMRERRGAHDPGRVVRDLAVMLASGGSHLAVDPIIELLSSRGSYGSLSENLRCAPGGGAARRSQLQG